MASLYRVHVYGDGGRGPWLASADFGRRPQHDEINAALPVLRSPGRYEVRINPVDRDGDEHSGWAWRQDAAPERVIFRKFLGSWTNGEIIALFPDLPDGRPGMVLSYMHDGQHSAASMNLIGGEPRTTRPAKPEEYAALKAELEHLSPEPYRLAVIQRTPRATNQPRNIQVRKTFPLVENDGRRNAAAEDDPLMLLGPDIIHYAELLIRFCDHRVLSPGYQFWGGLADYWNRIMHLPGQPARQYPGCWAEFNGAVATAVGYIRDVSPATDEQKRDLLRKYFPPKAL